MSGPAPTPGAGGEKLSPSRSDKAAMMAGTPAAIVGVMLFEDYTGRTLQTYEAVAVGGIFATVVGYLWHVFTVLLDRSIDRWSP